MNEQTNQPSYKFLFDSRYLELKSLERLTKALQERRSTAIDPTEQMFLDWLLPMTADITNEANANTINAAADVVATVKNKEINKSKPFWQKDFWK